MSNMQQASGILKLNLVTFTWGEFFMAAQYVVPIGIDNFRKLVTIADADGRSNLFVDKTNFIQEILRDRSEVILITRPRRFGKTINMSMLQHFLAAEVEGKPTKNLFDNLAIAKDQNAMACQGKYPVIFITFKDTNETDYPEAEAAIREQISATYEEFKYLLDSTKLMSYQRNTFQRILDKGSSLSELKNAIKNLSKYIYIDSGIKPYLLIDEYDTPMQVGYSSGYYEKITNLIKSMLGIALKGNSNIEKGILTGITRIAGESLFSIFNNPKIRTILDNQYSTYFGFTEGEVDALFHKAGLDYNLSQLKAWYNGYQCGDTLLYNPWSIMQALHDGGKISGYWINTSTNALVADLITNGGDKVYAQLEVLLQGKTIVENLDEHIVYQNIEKNRAAIWTLLVMAGYLKIVAVHTSMNNTEYELALPNKEVEYFYQNTIQTWLSGDGSAAAYKNFIKDLLAGDLTEFEAQLSS
ncbi:MAG TPA: AAA family ATPase, partial [Candidatus Babeliaceae bacterium]|nr:AAA family ATPase [Candidatus Babeliaceae bacterium]